MLSKHSPPPRFFIVAEENQQRLAFSDTIRSWGFEIVECLAASQLTEKHFQQKVDVWLVDTQDDYAVIQNIEKQLNVNLTKVVLLGFVTAPYLNESLLYAKWQRQLKRKIAIMLERSDLLAHYEAAKREIKPWKYVVLLAASMGGPLAIKEFLDNLPEDLPVSLLLAQHFNQNMLNTLPRILNRHNEWRCDIVTNTQKLLSGRCLILPIDHSVVCDSNGRVILQRKPWQGSYKPPISEVMRNCSEAFGNYRMDAQFAQVLKLAAEWMGGESMPLKDYLFVDPHPVSPEVAVEREREAEIERLRAETEAMTKMLFDEI